MCDISSLRVNGPSEPGRLRDVCVCQWVNMDNSFWTHCTTHRWPSMCDASEAQLWQAGLSILQCFVLFLFGILSGKIMKFII